MAINTKQTGFVNAIKELADKKKEMYGLCYNLYQSFGEDFETGKDNDLSTTEVGDYLATYGFDYTDIEKFCDRELEGFINFYTNQAVTQREYGKFIRKISGA